MNNDWTLPAAMGAAVIALFAFVKVLVIDVIVKSFKEDRDAWKALALSRGEIIDHLVLTTRTSVEATEKLVGRDGAA